MHFMLMMCLPVALYIFSDNRMIAGFVVPESKASMDGTQNPPTIIRIAEMPRPIWPPFFLARGAGGLAGLPIPVCSHLGKRTLPDCTRWHLLNPFDGVADLYIDITSKMG
jgi:hypothetical protein